MKPSAQIFLTTTLLALASFVITGCGTPATSEFPDADRISQRLQTAATVGKISNSPYVR